MRIPRMTMPDDAEGLYHLTNRLVDSPDMEFGDTEKQKLYSLLMSYAGFSGIQIVAWCLMDDHFHMLVRVPGNSGASHTSPTESEALKRMKLIYTKAEMAVINEALAHQKSPAARAEFLVPYNKRMGDLPMFVRSVKQRFSRWYNQRHKRKGTLWQDRYKSVLVEMDTAKSLGHAARVVAAYIDLNPVRAGLVTDPKDYPWCGFARASQGDKISLCGIANLFGKSPKAAMDAYAQMLGTSVAGQGTDKSKRKNPAIDAHRQFEGRQHGERLPLDVMLRLRTRYLVDGAIIGSPEFVRGVTSARGAHSAARSGKKMRFGDWGGLHTLRDLRVDVVQ